MKRSAESVHLAHRSNRTRLTTEDFVALVVHRLPEKQKALVEILKSGDFTTYADVGAKGAIGSALMFTPNVIIFDGDEDYEEFEKTRDFIRSQKLAKHIAQTHFLVIARQGSLAKERIQTLHDTNVTLVEYSNSEDGPNALRKNVFNLFRQAQKHFRDSSAPPVSEEVAASMQQQTASINEMLTEHKKFDEAVIRTFELLVKKVASGDPRKIFDTISKTIEILNRPFLLAYQSSSGEVYQHTFDLGRNIQKLNALLSSTQEINRSQGGLNKLSSDQDRRCFFGDQKRFYFVTESPIVFDELDNFSVITKNFEMYLLQAERRKQQLVLIERFRGLFSQVYIQMQGFEWSEALEEMQDIVNEMFAMESFEETQEEEIVSGELELF